MNKVKSSNEMGFGEHGGTDDRKSEKQKKGREQERERELVI